MGLVDVLGRLGRNDLDNAWPLEMQQGKVGKNSSPSLQHLLLAYELS